MDSTGQQLFLWEELVQVKIGLDKDCLIAWWAQLCATPFISLLIWYTAWDRNCIILWKSAICTLISQGTCGFCKEEATTAFANVKLSVKNVTCWICSKLATFPAKLRAAASACKTVGVTDMDACINTVSMWCKFWSLQYTPIPVASCAWDPGIFLIFHAASEKILGLGDLSNWRNANAVAKPCWIFGDPEYLALKLDLLLVWWCEVHMF